MAPNAPRAQSRFSAHSSSAKEAKAGGSVETLFESFFLPPFMGDAAGDFGVVFKKYSPFANNASAPAAVDTASSPLLRRTAAVGHVSLAAARMRAEKPPGGATSSTGISAASAALTPPKLASSRHAPTKKRPVAQSAAHTPIHGEASSFASTSSSVGAFPKGPPSSTKETTYDASGLASHIATSTNVPLVSMPTLARFTTESFVVPAALRSASCAGVSTCSTTTTRCPARANRSAFAA
mmetsp:Transcript_200/g.630  ORF Transcript_200/g.630 Transcript_200/m.630 type:complete len:238 (+) Transcript_200:2272-2985(+)